MSNRRPDGRRVQTRAYSKTTTACLPLLLIGFLVSSLPAMAGPFTDPGHAPSSMAAWVTSVEEEDIIRGPMDIANLGLGLASYGSSANVIGPATANPLDTCSLGDGGSITVYLGSGIRDASDDDFAVFENGFLDLNGLFAELAYVEVSTNGVDFARFDSDALNPFALMGFESLDPTDYHGLAGRHEAGLGTGFDLEDLDMDPLVLSGDVDLMDVRYVRLVDVIGDGSTLDGGGNAIYDPYATPFPSGGFDLEAVGVIHVPEPRLSTGLMVGALGLLGAALKRAGAANATFALALVNRTPAESPAGAGIWR